MRVLGIGLVVALAGCAEMQAPDAPATVVPPAEVSQAAAVPAPTPRPAKTPGPLVGLEAMDSPLACLSRTVYFESRGLPRKDKAAVAHVVLNRVEHRDYPDTICGVVTDGGPSAPCQFSWYCDGRPDVPGHRAEYAVSVRVARDVLAGEIDDPTDGANMFHNTSVNPRWARVAELKTQIGRHRFYYLARR